MKISSNRGCYHSGKLKLCDFNTVDKISANGIGIQTNLQLGANSF